MQSNHSNPTGGIRRWGSDCQKSRFAKNSAQKVFARLFQKAVGCRGKALARVPQDTKSLKNKAQEG